MSEDKGKAYKAVQTKVTFKIYDKEFEVSIKVIKISINKNTLLIIKGRTANVKLKGVSKGIKWSSNRKKIAGRKIHRKSVHRNRGVRLRKIFFKKRHQIFSYLYVVLGKDMRKPPVNGLTVYSKM